jgi:hypothetical protein
MKKILIHIVTMKKIVFTAFVLIVFLSCTKDRIFNPTPPRVNENPVFNFAFKQNGTGEIKPNFNLVASSTDYPTEFGNEFTVAKDGVLYAIGFRMPQTGKYIVSLWDVATKSLILRDSVDYTDPAKFLYKDFSAQGKDVNILKNKKYMASVYIPRLPTGGTRPNYTLFQPGIYNWVPFTQDNITITGSYIKKSDLPTFPDVMILHSDVLDGLVDIGFYKTEY